MEVRLRSQPNQDRIRVNPSAYPDLKNRWADRSVESDLCCILKGVVLCIGVVSIGLLVLVNSWQNIDAGPVTYRTRRIVIEEHLDSSDLVNYAADFNGAKIIRMQNFSKSVIEAIFSYNENNPEKVLSSDNTKGNCWGFPGSQSMIGITLVAPIYPLHFTFKHVNVVDFDSAPRHICVHRASSTEELLGCYDFFLYRGTPSPEFTQTFKCLTNCDKPTQDFLFKILDNHGAQYTCVYQILVHGDPIGLTY
jgi:hypothetical protein